MADDLRTVLHATTPEPREDLDMDAIARRGRRRRITSRIGMMTAGVAVVVAGTLGGVAVIGGDPPVILDQPEQGALGVWEPVPEAPLDAREGAHGVVDGETVVILGGEVRPDDGVEVDGVLYGEVVAQDGAVYDAGDGTWELLPDRPGGPVRDPSVALSDGRLAVIGGRELTPAGDSGVWTDSSHHGFSRNGAVLDLARGTWMPAPLPQDLEPRTFDVLAWADAGLVAWGGSSDDGTGGTYMDGGVWTADDGWTRIPPPPLDVRDGAAVGVSGDHLVVWGGYRPESVDSDADPAAMLGDGAVYDLRAGTWESLPDAPLAPRWVGQTGWPPSTNVYAADGRILIAGGYDGETQHLDGAWLDLEARTWTLIDSAPAAARYVQAHEGGVVAVDETHDGYVTLWSYQPDEDRWQELATRLGSDIELHDVTAERIVASAIGDDGQWQDSPRIGIWDGGEEMRSEQPPLTPRWRAVIAPLPDGVLVWSGTQMDADGEAVNSRGVADGARLRR